MKEKPVPLVITPAMERIAEELFETESERKGFLDALLHGFGPETSIVMLKDPAPVRTFPRRERLMWQPNFVERIQESFRPGTHPLHDQGMYYCMDTSSVFAASLMLNITDQAPKILDLCSAPGGKAIFAYRAFHQNEGELLLCNEINRRRTGSLILNLERCKIETAKVCVHDPNFLARHGEGQFDLVIVDAPCSGQSLLTKGMESAESFTPKMVGMNAARQRRIIANAARNVRPGGHLLYMTCTFSLEENERLVEWFIAEFPQFEGIVSPPHESNRSRHSALPCYRIYPQQNSGAGAFGCLLRRAPGDAVAAGGQEAIKSIWKFGDAPRTPRQSANSAPDPQPNKPSTKRREPRPLGGGRRGRQRK